MGSAGGASVKRDTFLCDTSSASVPRFNTGSLISFLSQHQGRGWGRRRVRWGGKIIEVSPLFRRRSFRSDPQFERSGHIFMQITASQFFPRRFPNSFLQMMCHYKEVYLNKFNTSLINPRRAPFKRSPATSGRARQPLPPAPPATTPHITVLAQGWRGRGRQEGRGGRERIISRTTHLKQIFIYIFIQLLNFISSHGGKGGRPPSSHLHTHTRTHTYEVI